MIRRVKERIVRSDGAGRVSKAYVRYRQAEGTKHCGSCAMYHPHEEGKGSSGTCDLVEGPIRADHVCDRWTAK